ncbi:MAG: signal peptide peptidase SppA [Planctomycetes bacterium]|nr:signal peptide peptidase SppA [Planctomycetota bacterium]
MPRAKQARFLMVGVIVLLSGAATAFAQLDLLRDLTRSKPAEDTGKKIAWFQVEGDVRETPSRLPPMFGEKPPTSLKSILSRLKQARQDPQVAAVVVDLQDAVLGLGQIEELVDAMRKFSATDKEVLVHADSFSMMTYAAACGASHISVVPTGDVWITGIAGEAPYLRGMLDKIGAVPDFEQCGDFKTAAESITRTGPSDNARQMNQWLFDGLYDNLVTLIADARETTPDKMRKLIDDGPYSAEAALAAGLIDSVKHRQEFVADLKKRHGSSAELVKDYGEDDDDMEIPKDSFFAMFEFMMKLLNPAPKTYDKPTIAVVYVEGTIMTGEAQESLFGASDGAFSTTVRRALDKAAEEDNVKAVVLRVDSPGGSALASEIILDATRRVVMHGKPLVVSMGNVAGSGGYYVTCAAETVFADKNTITASIGVLGGKLVTTETWKKLGVNWHAERRGAMSGMLSSSAPFSDQERAKIRRHMETVYEIFRGHVTKARGDRLKKPLDQLAGGRVFTGAQALDYGLVDKIGGLEEAIKFTAKRANLSDYDVRVIPEPPTILDLLTGSKDDDQAVRLGGRPGSSLLDLPLFSTMLPAAAALDPQRTRAFINAVRRVELLHREGVILMMPQDFVIR